MTMPLQPKIARMPYIKLDKSRIYGAAVLRPAAPYPNRLEYQMKLAAQAFLNNRAQTLFDPGLNPLVAERIRNEYGINDEDFKEILVSSGKVLGGAYGAYKGAALGAKLGTAAGSGVSAATAALIGGQLGPQAAIPEELITVPFAFIGATIGTYLGLQTGSKVGGAVAGLVTPSGLISASELIRDTLITSVEKQGAKGALIGISMLLGSTAGGWVGSKAGYTGLGAAIGGKIGTSTAIGLSNLVTGDDAEEVGLMTGLNMVGNTMDQFAGAAAIKASILAIQEKSNMQEMINKAYGDHETGFTQLDFSHIRKNTGMDLGLFGNGVIDFAGELLTDPGIWYSNLEAKNSKYARNTSAEYITEQSFRVGKTEENFYSMIGLNSAKRIGEIVKENAVAKLAPKTLYGKLAEAFQPNIKKFDGFEAFKRELLINNKTTKEYLLTRFVDADGKRSMKQIETFLKDTYKEIETGIINRMNDKSLRTITKHGLVRNKFGNMLEELEAKGLIGDTIDMNNLVATDLRRMKISYSASDYNNFIKNYRAFKLSDATDNALAQGTMFLLNPTMVAFGYGRRKMFKLLSHPASFRTFVAKIKNMAGINKVIDIKETNIETLFKTSKLLKSFSDKLKAEIKDDFYTKPLQEATNAKLELLNETMKQLDEIDAEKDLRNKENRANFDNRNIEIKETWQETKRKIKKDFRERNKEIHDETQSKIDEVLKQFEEKKKEVDDKIKKERDAISLTVFHGGERVVLDDTLIKIFREDIKRLQKIESSRPLLEEERTELNYKKSALGTHNWIEAQSSISEDIKLGINRVEHLLMTLSTITKSQENFWNFDHRNERFEDEISSLDSFRDEFFKNEKEIPNDVMNELWDRLQNKKNKKKFIGLYNETYKNKSGKYKFDEYWRRRENIKKRVIGYDSLRENERRARFIEDLKEDEVFMKTAKKYQEWIIESMEILRAWVGADPTKIKILKQLENKLKYNFTLSILNSDVKESISDYNKNGLDDELQGELEQVVQNLQQDINFARDNTRNTDMSNPGSDPMLFNDEVYTAFDSQLKELGLLNYQEIQNISKSMIDKGSDHSTFVREFDGVNKENFHKMLANRTDDDSIKISDALRHHFISSGIGFEDIISTDFQTALIMEYFKMDSRDETTGYYGSEYSEFFNGMSKRNLENIAEIIYGKTGESPLEDMMYSTSKAVSAKLGYTKINIGGESLGLYDFIERYGKEEDLIEFQEIENEGIVNTRGVRLGDFYAKRKQVEILDRIRDRYFYMQMNKSIIQMEVMFKENNTRTLHNLLDMINGKATDGIGKIFSDILEGNGINGKSKVLDSIRHKLEDYTASSDSKMNIIKKSGLFEKIRGNSYKDSEVIVDGFNSILRYIDKLGLLDIDENGKRIISSKELESKLELAEEILYNRFKKYMDHDVLEVLLRETVIETYMRYHNKNVVSTKLNGQFNTYDINQIIDVLINIKKSWSEQLDFEKASDKDVSRASQEGLQIEKDFNHKIMEDMDVAIKDLSIELRMPFVRAKTANDYLKTNLFESKDVQQKVNWKQLFNVNDLVFKNSPFILRQPRSKSDAARNKALFRFLYNNEGKFDDIDYETRIKILGEDIKEAPGPDGSSVLNPVTEDDAWNAIVAGKDIPEEEKMNVSRSISELADLLGMLKDYNNVSIDIYEFMKIWKILDEKGVKSYQSMLGLEYFTQEVFPNRNIMDHDITGLDGTLKKISRYTKHNKYMREFTGDQLKAVYGYYAMLMDVPNNVKNVPEFKQAFFEANKRKREIHKEKIEEYKKFKGFSKRQDVDKKLYFIFQNVPKEVLEKYLLEAFNLKNLNGKLRKVIKYAESLKDGDKIDYNSDEVRTLTSYIVRNMKTEGDWHQKVKTNLDIEKERVKNELRRDDLTDRQRKLLEKRRMQLRDKKYLSRTNYKYNWKERNRVDWLPEFIEGELGKQRSEALQEVFDESKSNYEKSFEQRSKEFEDELDKQWKDHQDNFKELIENQKRIDEEAKAKKQAVHEDLKKIHEEFGQLNPNKVLSVQSKAFELLTKAGTDGMLQFVRFIQAKGIKIEGGAIQFVREYNEFLESSREDGKLLMKDTSYSLDEEGTKAVRDTKSIDVDWDTMTFVNKWDKVQDIPQWMIEQDAALRTQDFKEVLNDYIVEKMGEPEFEFKEGTTRREISDTYQEEVVKAFDNKDAQRRRVFNLEKFFSHTLEDLAWYFTKDGSVNYEEMFKFLQENDHLRLMGIFKDKSPKARGYGRYQRDKNNQPILDEDGNPKLRGDSFEAPEHLRVKDMQQFLNGEYDVDKPVAKEILFSTAEELEVMMKDLIDDDGSINFTIGIMPIELMKRAQKVSFSKYQLPGPLQSYYTGMERVQKFDMLLNSSFHPRNLMDVIKKNSQMVHSLGDAVDYLKWGVNTSAVYFDLRTMQKNDFEMGTLLYKIAQGDQADIGHIEQVKPLIDKMLESREPELRQELEELRQNPEDNKYKIERLEAEYNSIQEIKIDWLNKKYQEAAGKMYEHHYSKIGFTHYVKLMEMDNIRNKLVSKMKFNPKYLLANEETKARMVEEKVEDRFNLLNIANQYQKTSAATDQTKYLRTLFDGDLGKHPARKLLETMGSKDVTLNEKHLKLMHYLSQEMWLPKNYMKIGTTIEQVGRLHGFLLQRHLFGTEYNKAIADSLKRHYDYSDRGAVETMATVAVPFIAFPTRNALFWAEQFSDASRIRRWYHLMNAVWGSYDGDEDNEYIQYARMNGYLPMGDTLVKLGDSRAGAMGMLHSPGQTIYNRLNPILKAPIETLKGNGSMSENMLKATPFIRRIPQIMDNYKAVKGGANKKAMLPGIFGTLYDDSDYNNPSFRYRRNVYNELYNFKGNRRQLSTNAYYRVRQIQYQQRRRKYI